MFYKCLQYAKLLSIVAFTNGHDVQFLLNHFQRSVLISLHQSEAL